MKTSLLLGEQTKINLLNVVRMLICTPTDPDKGLLVLGNQIFYTNA
jgi:hypothetical protein